VALRIFPILVFCLQKSLPSGLSVFSMRKSLLVWEPKGGSMMDIVLHVSALMSFCSQIQFVQL